MRSAQLATLSGGTMWMALNFVRAFGVKLGPKSAMTAFFDFLKTVPVGVELPEFFFDGSTLPPVLVAWLLGVYDYAHIIALVNAHIDANASWPGAIKTFCKNLVNITFNPDIMAKTTKINEKTKKLVQACHLARVPVYLVGLYDQASYERIDQLDPETPDILALFDRIAVSWQLPDAREQTQFDDAWWKRKLGLADDASCAFVDEGLLGKKGHLKVDELRSVLAR